jgi:DNA-binding transcriptional ArsR family regulator
MLMPHICISVQSSNHWGSVGECEVKQVDAGMAAAVRGLIDAVETSRLADLFKLLGDPTRARILYALVEAGEMCVCDISETVEVPEPISSHALRLLRTAGVVRNRRHGRMVHYSLDDAYVRMLLDLSLKHLRHDQGGAPPRLHGDGSGSLGHGRDEST